MIAERIYQWACQQPESSALIWNDLPLSYASFWRMIEGARSYFAVQNLPVEGTAIVLINHIVHAWITVMGLRAAGLNTIAVLSVDEAKKLAIKNAVCIVLSPAEPHLFSSLDDIFAGIKVLTIPHAVFANARSGEVTFNQKNAIPFGGHTLYTSGTTGTNKKLMISGNSQEQRNIVRVRSRSLGTHTLQHVVDFPLWTSMGFNQPSAVWHAGGCVVFDQRIDKFTHFFRQPITSATLVSTMLLGLLKAGARRGDHDFKLTIISGFLSLKLAEQAASELTKNIEVLYSSTELGNYALHSYFTCLDDLHWMKIADDRVVQVVDENGIECVIGEEGQLRVLITDIDSRCYLDDEETSRKVFHDGFFYPGDLAVKRADGRIRILGRNADVLNIRGTKVAVAPLEEKMQRHLGVEEVCIFSALNEQGFEEVVVAIETNRNIETAVLESLGQELSAFEQARYIVLREFPRVATGTKKVQRTELRKLIFPAVKLNL